MAGFLIGSGERDTGSRTENMRLKPRYLLVDCTMFLRHMTWPLHKNPGISIDGMIQALGIHEIYTYILYLGRDGCEKSMCLSLKNHGTDTILARI